MDSDDTSTSDRLEKQITFLKTNPDYIAVGGQVELTTPEGTVFYQKRFPTEHDEIKNMMFYSMPIQQATMMVNKKMLPKNFIWYNEKMETAEEVELVFKLLNYGKIANLNEVVYQYRQHPDSLSYRNPKKTFFLTFKARIAGVFTYQYRPTIFGVSVTLAQILIVSLLPSQSIYPVYYALRGLKNSLSGLIVVLSKSPAA